MVIYDNVIHHNHVEKVVYAVINPFKKLKSPSSLLGPIHTSHFVAKMQIIEAKSHKVSPCCTCKRSRPTSASATHVIMSTTWEKNWN